MAVTVLPELPKGSPKQIVTKITKDTGRASYGMATLALGALVVVGGALWLARRGILPASVTGKLTGGMQALTDDLGTRLG